MNPEDQSMPNQQQINGTESQQVQQFLQSPTVIPNQMSGYNMSNIETGSQPQTNIEPVQKQSIAQKLGKKRLILITAGVTLLLLVVITIIVVLAGGQKTAVQPVNNPDSDRPDYLLPASYSSLQQLNNSMSQDITGLHDDKDLMADKLSDKALGL